MFGLLPRGGWGSIKPPVSSQIDRGARHAGELVGSWDMREGGGLLLVDAASGYHARAESGLTWGRGTTGPALKFDLSHKAVVSPRPALYQLKRFTVEALFYYDATTADQAICEQTGASNSVNQNWLLFITGGTLTWRVCMSDISTFLDATFALTGGRWYHAVATYDGVSARLWVDGVLRATVSVGAHDPNPQGAGEFRIGILGGDFYPFRDRIELVRVYRGAIPAASVPHLRTAPYDQFAPPVWRRYVIVAPAGGGITGTGGITIGHPTLSGSGTYTPAAITGTGGTSIGAPSLAGSGTYTPPAITGTAGVSIGGPSLSGAGTYTPGAITGTAAVQIGPPGLAGSGTYAPEAITGTGALLIGHPTLSGSGSADPPGAISGSAAVSIGHPVLAGSGTYTPEAITGAAAVQIGPPSLAGSGTYAPGAVTGSGAVQIGHPTLSGSGTISAPPITGTGAVTIGHPILAGGSVTPDFNSPTQVSIALDGLTSTPLASDGTTTAPVLSASTTTATVAGAGTTMTTVASDGTTTATLF